MRAVPNVRTVLCFLLGFGAVVWTATDALQVLAEARRPRAAAGRETTPRPPPSAAPAAVGAAPPGAAAPPSAPGPRTR